MSNKLKRGKKVKMEEKFDEVGGFKAMEIENLNDDCLKEIFKYLPIADRIRLERVSKRWQTISKQSWCNFKCLDFEKRTWGLGSTEENGDNNLIKTRVFDNILKLSGRYLTSISTDITFFSQICHLLPNIREVDLADDCSDKCFTSFSCPFGCSYDAWKEIIPWLISHGDRITSFKTEMYNSHCDEEDFTRMLEKMKNLKFFYLKACNKLIWNGTFLLQLPFSSIEEIVLLNFFLQPFDNNLLSLMITKCKKLKRFCIRMHIEGSNESLFEALSSKGSSLRSLHMEMSNKPSELSMMMISSLIHLERLSLVTCKFVNDSFVEAIAENCKNLKFLDITGCENVTDRGISSLCNLQKLAYLSIAHVNKASNPTLEKLKNLVALDCRNSRIQEECLCSFLKNANQLRSLNISRCKLITNKLLNVAVEIFKMRDYYNALDLHIQESGIDLNLVGEKLPSLNIIIDEIEQISYYRKFGIEFAFPHTNKSREVFLD